MSNKEKIEEVLKNEKKKKPNPNCNRLSLDLESILKELEVLEAFSRRLCLKENGEMVVSTYSGPFEEYEDVQKDLKTIEEWVYEPE